MFENIEFLTPKLWIFFGILWLIGFLLFFRTRKFYFKNRIFEDLEKMFWKNKKIFFLKFLLVFLIIFSYIFYFLSPVLVKTRTEIPKDWIDIVVVFDLSISMLAWDVEPNRLEQSKKTLTEFISKLKTDRIGMTIFAGKPFLWIPLTFDYEYAKNYISNLSVDSINQELYSGTASWDALLFASTLFEDNSDRSKVIIFFTDWDTTSGLNTPKTIKLLNEKNIKIHTVWIWWVEDSTAEYKDRNFEIKPLNEEELENIAKYWWGKFIRAVSQTDFENIFAELDLLPKNELISNEIELYKNMDKKIINFLIFLFLVFFTFNASFYIKK